MLLTAFALVIPPVAGPTAAGAHEHEQPPWHFVAGGYGGGVRFEWSDIWAPEYHHLVIRQRVGGPITEPTQGTKVYEGVGALYDPHTLNRRIVRVGGLTNGTMYDFTAFGYTADGHVLWSKSFQTTPDDAVGPLCPIMTSAWGGKGSITIKWKNPPDPDLAAVIVYSYGATGWTELHRAPAKPGETGAFTVTGMGDHEKMHVAIDAVDTGGRLSHDRVGKIAYSDIKTRVSLQISDSVVNYGATLRLHGLVEGYEYEDLGRWMGLGRLTLSLYRRPVGATTWSLAGSEISGQGDDLAGKVTFDVEPVRNMEYQLRYNGDGQGNASTSSLMPASTTSFAAAASLTAAAADSPYNASTSGNRTALVRPRISAVASDNRVRLHDRLVVKGGVRPRAARGVVSLQRRTSSGWRTIDSRKIRDDATYLFRATAARRGTFKYRVVRGPDRRFARGRSANVRVVVR